MKEEFQPLEPVGHEATEARVVAWVHGEVSPAEAAELERLCAQRPDLNAFRRQLTGLHDLLGEAVTVDEAWKLAPERRARLLAAFEGSPAASPVRSLRPRHRWVRPVLWAAAASVALAAGFHFIVAPLGDTRLAADSKPLPTVTMLPREAPTATAFRREPIPADGGAIMDLDEFAAPAAPAAMAALESSADAPLAAAALSAEARQFRDDALRKAVPVEEGVVDGAVASRAAAGMPETAVMAAPLRRGERADAESKAEASEREARVADVDRALEASPLIKRGEWAVQSGRGSGGPLVVWRFSRAQNGAPGEAFTVTLSRAKEARGYALGRGVSAQLLVADEKGVECSQKLVTVDGKTMTVEALLREALAKE